VKNKFFNKISLTAYSVYIQRFCETLPDQGTLAKKIHQQQEIQKFSGKIMNNDEFVNVKASVIGISGSEFSVKATV
jgi:hypothetical protein